MTNPTAAESRNGKLVLLTLMLIPVFVVLAATFVFYTGIGMPKTTHNKGVLVVPPLQLNDLHPTDMDGKVVVFDGTAKSGTWTFLTVQSAACNESCKQRFWLNRQTRTALGKYSGHLQRVWLVTGGAMDKETTQWLKKEHSDVVVLHAGDEQWHKLLKQTNYSPADEKKTNFFLVDPRGFVMMYYTVDNTYKDVMKDIKFLLKEVE